jgi:signal transduction histidine kinase
MRESVSALRTLLMDFYPADLESRGLAAALADLVALARSRGLDGRIEVAADMGAPHETEGLLYRVAQEALRNAVAHAQATVVTVRAGTDRGLHWLEVCDDGGGFDPRQSPSEGHIGLRALDGLLRDAGGRLEVESDPAEGTVVRALVPVGVTGAEDSAPLLG